MGGRMGGRRSPPRTRHHLVSCTHGVLGVCLLKVCRFKRQSAISYFPNRLVCKRTFRCAHRLHLATVSCRAAGIGRQQNKQCLRLAELRT